MSLNNIIRRAKVMAGNPPDELVYLSDYIEYINAGLQQIMGQTPINVKTTEIEYNPVRKIKIVKTSDYDEVQKMVQKITPLGDINYDMYPPNEYIDSGTFSFVGGVLLEPRIEEGEKDAYVYCDDATFAGWYFSIPKGLIKVTVIMKAENAGESGSVILCNKENGSLNPSSSGFMSKSIASISTTKTTYELYYDVQFQAFDGVAINAFNGTKVYAIKVDSVSNEPAINAYDVFDIWDGTTRLHKVDERYLKRVRDSYWGITKPRIWSISNNKIDVESNKAFTATIKYREFVKPNLTVDSNLNDYPLKVKQLLSIYAAKEAATIVGDARRLGNLEMLFRQGIVELNRMYSQIKGLV